MRKKQRRKEVSMFFSSTSFLSSRPLRRYAGLVLTVSLLLPQAVPVRASETEAFQEQVLTRVDQVNDNGLVRSHWEDADGRLYTDGEIADDSSTDTDSGVANASSLKGNSLTGKTASLPASYDLRDYGLTTSIKDQGVTGCCWAFSAIKAIESNRIKQGLATSDTADYSENHLTWFSYSPSTDLADPLYGDGITVSAPGSTAIFPSSSTGLATANTYPYDNGGSSTLATFTLSKWSGVELEANAPFNAATRQALFTMASQMPQKASTRYHSYAHLQNAICFDEYTLGTNYYYKNTGMISEMKQAILDHGAMSIGFYYDKSNVKTTTKGTTYYQTDYSGATAVKAANHCVTIVGWDDSFSSSNFSPRPAGNGAWLIANSYGTDFGDNGYFWLSYYDQSICDCYTFITESTDNYDNIYQYDGFGWSNAAFSSSHNIKAANIFTASADSPQLLRAVSFYTLTDDQEYKIQIYRGVSSKPTDGTLISECTTTGVLEHNGYYTIPLASPVSVNAGEKFSVVVTYIRPGSDTIYVPFEGKNSTASDYSLQFSSKKGQSFLYTTVTTSATQKWYDTSELGYNNVCIKVFADQTDTATPTPISSKKIILGKGETYQLKKNAQGYTSMNTSVASVTSAGKVTAKSVGSTSVQITNGTTTTLVPIVVKKAPSKIQLNPSGKKKIKRGRSFRIKVKLPSGTASKKITYRSSHKKVATVTATGKVKARKKGTAVIRVRTYNGKTAKLKVTVK